MVAPRRYGKSSLCEHAFSQINFPHKVVDLHVAVTEDMVGKILVEGITDIIYKSIGKGTEKLMLLARQYAKKIQPKLGMGPECLRLELNISHDSSPAENIFDSIMVLEKLLQNKMNQKKLMIYLANNVGVKNIYSIETSKQSGIAISSMARTLDSLQERDFIEKEGGVFCLTVPIYRQLLKRSRSSML